ncbi:hypothetical protein WR25_06171 [Diploscapter pachys]|uniref:Uncharacterized protein n=1 Tax=Diploscapter pachys TaxID=2018661 RepID=A0A2A2LSD2_9BILA|nr:hypothetical protein WR25_06171 [Diploscapter pachys]
MTTQSDQIRKEYRRWRFEVDRETIPEFVNNQTPGVQATLRQILAQRPSLEEFYKKALEMRTSLTNYDEFLEWANSEYL